MLTLNWSTPSGYKVQAADSYEITYQATGVADNPAPITHQATQDKQKYKHEFKDLEV